jgi:hypothetical protein
MAGRIRTNLSVSWSNENVGVSMSVAQSYDQTGTEAIGNAQIIGASSETITFGDVTTIGYLGFKNLNADDGATIHLGTTSPVTAANAQVSLAPGDGVFVPIGSAAAGNAWYGISSTGSSSLFVLAIEA